MPAYGVLILRRPGNWSAQTIRETYPVHRSVIGQLTKVERWIIRDECARANKQ